MKSISRQRATVLFAIVLALATAAAGQSSQQALSSTPVQVKIKNFGQIDERFYRGAQPKKEHYAMLATLGVKTVIDLREDPEDYEKPAVEALGMRYVNIPMSDKQYPQEAQISAFLKLVDDPNTGTFFIHCAGGRHRTGVMGAVYRMMKYGWNFDQVYAEMKQFDFYTRWGHGDMKRYVVDYAARMEQNRAVNPVAATVLAN